MKRMLMVVHEASRTGAPVLALTLLRWLLRQGRLRTDVLLLKSGLLAGEFEAATTSFDGEKISGRSTLAGRILNRGFKINPQFWLKRTLARVPKQYDYVYGNCIVALPALLTFDQQSGVRRVCAVHELTSVIDCFFTRDYVRENLPKMDLVVAGSQSVADNLVKEYAIDRRLIRIVHAFIDASPPPPRPSSEMRRSLGIDAGDVVIGGVGTPNLRKGVDFLPKLAGILKDRHPSLRFKLVWLGANADDSLVVNLKAEALALGVGKEILFCEPNDSPNDYINMYDVFMLPSREDPFPLVAVTAAFLEKPIVAFDGSGGMSELLADGAGLLVPHLDAERFAQAIAKLLQDPALAVGAGRAASARVRSKYGSEAGCLALFEAITGGYGDRQRMEAALPAASVSARTL